MPSQVNVSKNSNPVEEMLLAINSRKTEDGQNNLAQLKKLSQDFYFERRNSVIELEKEVSICFGTRLKMKPAGDLTKCWLLFSRSMGNTVRDKKLFLVYVLQQLCTMIFLGLIYKNTHRNYDDPTPDQYSNLRSRIGSFFFIVMNLYFSSLINTALKMGQEALIIYKEIRAGLYHSWHYYWTKSFIDLIILVPLIFVTVSGVDI